MQASKSREDLADFDTFRVPELRDGDPRSQTAAGRAAANSGAQNGQLMIAMVTPTTLLTMAASA